MENTKNIPEIDWVIYKIESPTGRVYIGKTRNIIRRRWSYSSRASCYKQPLLHRSILKYGWKNHKMEILETFKSDSSYCNDKEMFWIRTFMSNRHKWPHMRGMNLTDGGRGNTGWIPSPEVKAKIGIANRKPKHTEEWKKAVSEFHKGHKYDLGKKHTKESIQKGIETKRKSGKKINRGPASDATKLKMRLSKLGKKHKSHKSPITHYSKPVAQYDKLGNKIAEYEGIQKASDITGISYDTIYYDLRKKGKGGASDHRRIKERQFIFKYLDNAPN